FSKTSRQGNAEPPVGDRREQLTLYCPTSVMRYGPVKKHALDQYVNGSCAFSPRAEFDREQAAGLGRHADLQKNAVMRSPGGNAAGPRAPQPASPRSRCRPRIHAAWKV